MGLKAAANRVLLIVLLATLALVAGSSIGSRQALAQSTLGTTTTSFAIGNTEGYNKEDSSLQEDFGHVY